MQESETEAVEKVNRFRDVIENKTPSFHGRIIQYYGDGCLLLFYSAVDAVALVKDLQTEFCEEPQLPVRIGIHIGDVLLFLQYPSAIGLEKARSEFEKALTLKMTVADELPAVNEISLVVPRLEP